jgi:hypothetical protein
MRSIQSSWRRSVFVAGADVAEAARRGPMTCDTLVPRIEFRLV